MSDTISVPSELLTELRDAANDCYNNEVRRYKDDRRRIIYKALVDKADELLASSAAEVEGLEVVAWQDAENPLYTTGEKRQMHGWATDGYPIVELVRLSDATAVIEHLQGTIASFEEGSERMALKGIEMRLELDQQAARIAELQNDADRYRWLEANSTYGIDYRQRPELTLPIYAPDHHEGLDAAIDAAMEGSSGE